MDSALSINAKLEDDEKSLLDRVIDWRVKHISDNQFVLLLSFFV